MGGEPLLEVRGLRKWFPVAGGLFGRPAGYLKAVDGVSFTIYRGETFGLVGESGCGKTTTGRLVLGLEKPSAGDIRFEGTDIKKASTNEMRHLRRRMQIVFQNPYSSLDPRMTVGDLIGEPLMVHGVVRGKARQERIAELLQLVGLQPESARRFPHEFSGGQRQRIGIARALALNPDLVVLDEPVSALDVSIQSQVLNLLQDLQHQLGLTYLFIAHDLAVVKHISDRVGVMYLGKIVEMGPADELFRRPLHPYTRALMSAIPVPDPDVKPQRIVLEGDVPSPINPPPGCRFQSRCPLAMDICRQVEPDLVTMGENHQVACHQVTPSAVRTRPASTEE